MQIVMGYRSAVAITAAPLLLVTLQVTTAQDVNRGGWLDRPLVNWNTPGATLPHAPGGDDPIAVVERRCQLKPPRSTAAEKAVDTAGWIPFWNVDQQLLRDDVEIVGGMRAADGACQPTTYNLFVFVGGQFAGTLSPSAMQSAHDGSSAAVRVAPPMVTAEFARYATSDPPCCPSSRVTVRYRIDRAAAGPLVVPLEIRTTRP